MREIIRGLTLIGRFTGRDSRGQFWPYALSVFAVFTIGLFVTMPLAMSSMFGEMNAFAQAHPDQATVTVGSGGYSVQLHEGAEPLPDFDMTPMFVAMAVWVAAIAVMTAAAVTRRLHDRGLTGWIAILPLALLVLGLALFPRMMNSFTSDTPDMGLFGLVMLTNVAYLISLGGLVVLLALPGQPRPNRHGPAPEDRLIG
ncbi:DUF805 domain-containing protein [Brevundimonas lutea]|uniref:DUF805 domain-containing protein n=1 Tax=Brevundimonas lutea TaxID=2293980 RepID=UPI000F03D4B2|nr:DUF805 domain-containing protein [Brevundimonas lutea]